MRVRLTIDSNWRRKSVWIYGVWNTNTNIHFTWIVLKPNEMRRCIFKINIQYNIININCTRGYCNIWNCQPSKISVSLGFSSVAISFLGVTISRVTLSCSQYLYIISFKKTEIFKNIFLTCSLSLSWNHSRYYNCFSVSDCRRLN